MKKRMIKVNCYAAAFFLLGFIGSQEIFADTFKHKTSDQVYHGYAHQNAIDGKTRVVTVESGPVDINLAEYTITLDEQGRNRTVCVFTLNGPIEYEILTAALEKAIVEESNKGPLCILIEIDSPGGRVDLATRLCTALTQTRNCMTVAFIKGGDEGGAFSAAAAVSIACKKIYMTGATVIGAATVIDGRGYDLEKVRGKDVAEKIRSAWRNYMASLAEENQRPAAMARAMENKDIEVVQVQRNNKTLYLEKTEALQTDTFVRIQKPKGQILTLPAGEAVACGMADKVVANLQDVLADLNFSDAKVERPDGLAKAQAEQEKVNRKFEQLKNNLDTKLKTLGAKNNNGGLTINEAKRDYKALIQEFKYLLKLKKNYPDVPCDEEDIQDIINSIQAELDSF